MDVFKDRIGHEEVVFGSQMHNSFHGSNEPSQLITTMSAADVYIVAGMHMFKT